MICPFLLLGRLHPAQRRWIGLALFLLALTNLRAQVTSSASSTTPVTSTGSSPATGGSTTTFTVGSTQISTATGAPLPNLGTGLTAAEAQAAYNQYTALRTQILETRRQAVIAAAKAPDDATRAKIFAAYKAAQSDNLALLRQLHSQVIPVEKEAQAQAAMARLQAAAAVPPAVSSPATSGSSSAQ